MEAFPLRIQERVQHLPPRTTVQHEGQPHYRRNRYEDGIHCQMFWVNSEDSQESNSSNNAAKDKKEDDKRWEATRFFPFLFACKTTDGFNNYLHTKCLESPNHYSHGIGISDVHSCFHGNALNTHPILNPDTHTKT